MDNKALFDQDLLDRLNANAPGFIGLLGGSVIEVDAEARSCTFEFQITEDFCHSGDIVQGGFITAMLDAAMSHAVFSCDPTDAASVVNVSSLEIKTSYLEPTRAGYLLAVGTIMKATYKTAFLEGHLFNADGVLTATTSSVAKIVRAR